MNVVGLARAVNDVATRTRSKKLTPDEVHGGTFTITNPGPFGSLISVPIMNPGETAILAFDAIEKRPVVVDDMIGIRHMVLPVDVVGPPDDRRGHRGAVPGPR